MLKINNIKYNIIIIFILLVLSLNVFSYTENTYLYTIGISFNYYFGKITNVENNLSAAFEFSYWMLNEYGFSRGIDIGLEGFYESEKSFLYSELQGGTVIAGISFGPNIVITSPDPNEIGKIGLQYTAWGGLLGYIFYRGRYNQGFNNCIGFMFKYPIKHDINWHY